ncbi:CheR family methyltransferase [Methylosinus sp. KRF6]|uniref:CheR family methyltransferase n=1 Tax=Methylosinus sp. KRF6 TaxID=2846853 RepID=UPI001C0BB7F9|nr:hypothetical protein [Methylosinus sp. KRF6]
MRDEELVSFLQWALPILRLRWRGFLNVRRQVGKRLNRRLAELGLPTLDDYRERLRADTTEWAVLDSFFRVTISRFYRDRRVFDILRFRVLPELARAAHSPGRTIRCWCAGCACGEEVYTVEPDLGARCTSERARSLVRIDRNRRRFRSSASRRAGMLSFEQSREPAERLANAGFLTRRW